MSELRANDNNLKKKSGIRIAREQRANKSEQFRQTLQTEIIENAIKLEENDSDVCMDKTEQKSAENINKLDTDGDIDISENNIAVLTIDNSADQNPKKDKITLTEMERELIEVHGQTLVTCTAQELEEVIRFIKQNITASNTTPFAKGTIICDSDGKQRLDLCKQQLGPRNTQLISKAMSANDKISALLLGANGIGNNGAKAVADLINKNNKNLNTIFLGCNLIKEEGIRALAESLHSNTNVRGLWLKRNPIGIEGSKYIADMLRNNTYLRTLDLVSTGLEEKGVQNIINALCENRKSALQRIYLGALNISNTSFISNSLSKMFINCLSLKEVFLSTNNIGDSGAVELSKILLIATQIEILSMKSCDISDDGAIALAWAITTHKNLKYLDFGYAVNTKPIGGKANRISDRGATVFAQALSIVLGQSSKNASNKFERLSLANNHITDIGARAILSALQNANKNGNYQMLHVSLDRNVKIQNSLILQYISQICDQNQKWNAAQQQSVSDKCENDTDNDIKMDGNTDIGVSEELRNERIVKQQIYTNLGEIRLNENVKNANNLSGAEHDSLEIRSVYRNPKEKQFCPRLVKDNNGEILDKLTVNQILQCHGTGVGSINNKNGTALPNVNTNTNNSNDDDLFKYIDNTKNKNIRKRNKRFIKKAMEPKSEINKRFDIYTHRQTLEPAPRLSSDQRLPRAFGSTNTNTNNSELKTENAENVLNFARKCYVCKRIFNRLHFFYDSLCNECGDYNFYQRFDSHSCANKVAIVTGARIKIGYEIALKLLRSQCTVIVTTRFPRYAAIKYSKEKDFKTWMDNLCILGLDFCRLNSVDKFIKYIVSKYKHIDFLINNAATTVRRTPEFYADIIEIEKKKLPANIPQKLVIQYEHFTDSFEVAPPLMIDGKNTKAIEYKNKKSERTENIINKVLGDLGEFDEHSQPIDLRNNNSWTATLGHIHPIEIMETIMVNQFVPFLFINQLIPLLSNKKQLFKKKVYYGDRFENGNGNENIWKEVNDRSENIQRSYVINVSAMEGRFHFFKQGTHPHTNMAKAALNMLTRTSALKLAQKHNIFMVSVDTGWVTDELPLKRRIKSKIFQRDQQNLMGNIDDSGSTNKNKNGNVKSDKNDFIFHAPLDEIDGAARVLHPIWNGLRGRPYCGVFLKDYRRIDW